MSKEDSADNYPSLLDFGLKAEKLLKPDKPIGPLGRLRFGTPSFGRSSRRSRY